MRRLTAAALVVAVSMLAVSLVEVRAIAQDAIVRTPLEKSEYPGPEHVSHLMRITVAPGAVVAPHTHPGIEMGYLVEGEASMSIAGQPDRQLKAGDTYLVPAGVVHSAKNTGTTPIMIVGTFVVEKSKPLATPVK